MLKVRFEPVTVMVPFVDNSGEHDAKMPEELYQRCLSAYELLGSVPVRPGGVGPSLAAVIAERQLAAGAHWAKGLAQDLYGPIGTAGATSSIPGPLSGSLLGIQPAPPSQEDPVINTAVTDREMNSSTPDMSLEEFRERPDRTKAPPRPRANSWRHER